MKCRGSWGALAITGSALVACSIPLNVRRIDPPGAGDAFEIRGIRYQLKRPKTTISLRLKAPADKLESMGDAVDGGGDCVPYDVDVLIEQTMVETWVYEAEYAPNPLANTDVTLTLQEDGTLAAVSAGESDQVLPFIQAVAGLAVKAAAAKSPKASQSALTDKDCEIKSLEKIVKQEKQLRESRKKIKEQITQWQAKLQIGPGRAGAPDYHKLQLALASLQAELQRIEAARAVNKHELEPTEAVICVDGKELDSAATPCPKSGAGELLRIDLETKA